MWQTCAIINGRIRLELLADLDIGPVALQTPVEKTWAVILDLKFLISNRQIYKKGHITKRI